jgi:hypothetical protein
MENIQVTGPDPAPFVPMVEPTAPKESPKPAAKAAVKGLPPLGAPDGSGPAALAWPDQAVSGLRPMTIVGLGTHVEGEEEKAANYGEAISAMANNGAVRSREAQEGLILDAMAIEQAVIKAIVFLGIPVRRLAVVLELAGRRPYWLSTAAAYRPGFDPSAHVPHSSKDGIEARLNSLSTLHINTGMSDLGKADTERLTLVVIWALCRAFVYGHTGSSKNRTAKAFAFPALRSVAGVEFDLKDSLGLPMVVDRKIFESFRDRIGLRAHTYNWSAHRPAAAAKPAEKTPKAHYVCRCGNRASFTLVNQASPARDAIPCMCGEMMLLKGAVPIESKARPVVTEHDRMVEMFG